MYCPNCGTKQNYDSNFCSVCGAKMQHIADHNAASGIPKHTDEATNVEQSDLTTRLVGENANYYFKKWSLPDSFKGWNWVAFFFYIPWLGYRKMYDELKTFLAFYGLYTAVIFRLRHYTVVAIFDVIIEILIMAYFGYMGNILYKEHIEKMKLKHLNDPTKFSIEKIGGISMPGLILGIAVEIVLIIFFWNLW